MIPLASEPQKPEATTAASASSTPSSTPPAVEAAPAAAEPTPAEELPSKDLLELDLVRVLLEPPELAAARDLLRDLGRRTKRTIAPLLLAEALMRLTPHQRSSRPQERTFLRSALLGRLQRGSAWINEPMIYPLGDEAELEEGELEDGTWTWRFHSFAIESTAAGRRGVLHLWLKNGMDTVGVGQPVAIVLTDAEHAYAWSPIAGSQVPPEDQPAGSRGSLATVAVEPETEILGHLSFPLPADAEPTGWGLQLGPHHAHLRPLKA